MLRQVLEHLLQIGRQRAQKFHAAVLGRMRERQPGGMEAVNLRVADRYVDAFGNLAKTNNTLIVPANLADVSSLIAAALTVIKSQAVPR